MAASHAYADAFAGRMIIDSIHSKSHIIGRTAAIAAMVAKGTPHADAIAYVSKSTPRWRANLRADRAEYAAWLRGDL